MKIAVIGAGAMGSAIGGGLAKAGNEVTLVDVWREAIDTINQKGLRIDDRAGNSEVIKVHATDKPAEAGVADLVLVFVKCYHTEAAVKNAMPIIGANTIVLSLQNGWGNGPRIASIVGQEKLLIGVCYHSATVLGPGHVLHAGKGMTFIGEQDGKMTERLKLVADTFTRAGIEVTSTANVRKEIWAKLALNVATLPTSASLRITADRLLETPEMQSLMRELLVEVVAVAQAQKIDLDLEERWNAITGLLKKLAPNTKGSMLQDVENRRRTEIDVINGAIVEAGQRLGIRTPYNNAMVWLIKAVESSIQTASKEQYPLPEHADILRRLRADELPMEFKEWCGNDANGNHHHGVISLNENPVFMRLFWKRVKTADPSLIGCFCLNLEALLKGGYVRMKDTDTVRLRFFHADDDTIYIQTNSDGPKVAIGRLKNR